MMRHQPGAAAVLAEWRDSLVTEAVIGGFDKLPQLIDRKGRRDERRHDAGRHIRIRLPGEGLQVIRAQCRPDRRHIKPAVPGEAGQSHISKIKLRRTPARTYLVHILSPVAETMTCGREDRKSTRLNSSH